MVSKIKILVRDRAFLIRAVSYRDHDRILSFLTQKHGRVDVMAHGARKSLKRFSGILDFLHELELEYEASPRGGLERLVGAQLVETFPGIRGDYDRTMTALAWLKLLNKVFPAGARVPGVFPLLQRCLHSLSSKDRDWVDLVFQRNCLSALGYHLQLSDCVRCGLRDAGPYVFQAPQGGLLCPVCAGKDGERKTVAPFPESWWLLEEQECPWQSERISEARGVLEEAYLEFFG